MGRKANGEGTYTKLPSGSVRYRDWVEVNGVRQRKSFTATNKTAAKQLWKDYCASAQKVAIEKVSTVSQWAEHWVKLYKAESNSLTWKPSADYEMYVRRHIVPAIGNLKLMDVRPAHIKQLYSKARTRPTKAHPEGKPLSNSSLEKIKIALNGIFETAVENNLCVSNPVSKVKIDLTEINDIQQKVFSPDHMERILEFLPKHKYGSCIALLLYSGLRKGELIALLKSDHDDKNHHFIIRRTLTRKNHAEIIEDRTKGKRARVVPYNPDDLTQYIDQLNGDSIYLISRPDGSRHSYTSFDNAYYSFFDDLNGVIQGEAEELSQKTGVKVVPVLVPRLTPHKCRHTYATYLMRNGVHAAVIQELLGHADISTTRIYESVNVDDLKKGATKLKFS